MKQLCRTAAQKRPYLAPELLCIHITSAKMISTSGPEVYTTSEKASNDYDALSKEHQSVWDDEW